MEKDAMGFMSKPFLSILTLFKEFEIIYAKKTNYSRKFFVFSEKQFNFEHGVFSMQSE